MGGCLSGITLSGRCFCRTDRTTCHTLTGNRRLRTPYLRFLTFIFIFISEPYTIGILSSFDPRRGQNTNGRSATRKKPPILRRYSSCKRKCGHRAIIGNMGGKQSNLGHVSFRGPEEQAGFTNQLPSPGDPSGANRLRLLRARWCIFTGLRQQIDFPDSRVLRFNREPEPHGNRFSIDRTCVCYNCGRSTRRECYTDNCNMALWF